MKREINYTYFAVKEPESLSQWDGEMLCDLECDSITELRKRLKEKGYTKDKYHVIYCALCENGNTTYFGYGFNKLEARNDLMNQL